MTSLTNKQKAGIAGVALLTAFAMGRFSTPVKTVIKTQTVEVEKKNEKTDTKESLQTHKTTTITEKQDPNGNVERTTRIDESTGQTTNTNSTDKSSTAVSQDTLQETVRGSSQVTLSALAGVNISSPEVVYGASITKPVLGPIAIGLWALSNKTAGASLGLTF